MGVLDDMAQQARLMAAKLKVNITSEEKLFLSRQRELEKAFDTELSLYIKNYSNTESTVPLDRIHDSNGELVDDIHAATKAMQRQIADVDGMVTGLQTTITNVQNSTDYDALDASSKQLLNDFSREYKSAYAIMWAKVILVAFLLYYLRQEWVLIVVAYIAVYVAWAIISALINIFRNVFRKRGKVSTLKAARCANVTSADSVGSGCPRPDAPTYIPCSTSDFGCCANGLAAPADRATCGTIDCWKTAFGCCSNGSPKTSATDTCDALVDCKTTEYGCCRNGMPRIDAVGSNCTINSSCGYTAFGCCPDGTLRNDALGSNCSGVPTSPVASIIQIADTATVTNKVKHRDSKNPFTTPNNAFNKSFTSALHAIS